MITSTPPAELLEQHGVAAVAAARRPHLGAQSVAVVEQRIDALLAVSLGQLDRRLHQQERTRRLVDQIADPTVAQLAGADLRALFHDHALHRGLDREIVHDGSQVRRARATIGAGLGGAARRENAMGVRPVAQAQRLLGQQVL